MGDRHRSGQLLLRQASAELSPALQPFLPLETQLPRGHRLFMARARVGKGLSPPRAVKHRVGERLRGC